MRLPFDKLPVDIDSHRLRSRVVPIVIVRRARRMLEHPPCGEVTRRTYYLNLAMAPVLAGAQLSQVSVDPIESLFFEQVVSIPVFSFLRLKLMLNCSRVPSTFKLLAVTGPRSSDCGCCALFPQVFWRLNRSSPWRWWRGVAIAAVAKKRTGENNIVKNK